MSSAFVTVCPACATRFRVTDAQLQAAGGRVRCGACLDVFDALLHVERSGADNTAGPVAAAEGTFTDPSAAPVTSAAVNSQEADEVALARDLLRSRSGQLEPTAARGLRFTLVEEGQADVAAKNAQGNQQGGGDPFADRAANNSSAAPSAHAAMQAGAGQRRRRSVLDHISHPTALSDEERRRLSALGVEPDLDENAPRRRRLVLPAIAAVTLLLAQYVYFRADALASSLAWRPWYAGVCHVFGCTVPVFRDGALLHSRNMIMRPHPRRPDVLLIDAQVLNDAPYPQPFPDVLVEILDHQGGTLSSRVFTPMDYRRGELATIPLVPPHRPLQLSLEVFNPGKAAVNFRFELQPSRR